MDYIKHNIKKYETTEDWPTIICPTPQDGNNFERVSKLILFDPIKYTALKCPVHYEKELRSTKYWMDNSTEVSFSITLIDTIL